MSYRANMEYEDLQVKLQQWVVKNKERLNALCVTSGRGASGYDGLSAAQRDYLCSLLLLQDNMELRAIPPEKQYSRVTITKPENFDAETGKSAARNNAVRKIWSLLGYSLREKLHLESTTTEGLKNGNKSSRTAD